MTTKPKARDRIDKDESERHYKGKVRLCKIFRDHGFKAQVERRFPCFVDLGGFTCKYRADVYAIRKGRKIIAEVDGYRGHKTQRAVMLQNLRTRRIKQSYGEEIEVFRFTLKRLARWTNKEIAEEMRL